ncbi:MAG: homoserine O-acetyltransferase [Planctomycetota bacterium]|jgi:homoserine O-acetyltransferase|nr:MAG: homoserine O-acetyltransferase [Planctomycetota bacterium]
MSAPLQEEPISDTRSAEIVQTQFVDLFQSPNVLKFANGETLSPVRVAYETYGTLNSDASNAIFICHALTGDAHAAGIHSTTDRKPGWWDNFIGPGKGIDTSKYFVICANVLGGCQGTTGPGCVNPETGKRFCLTFPFLTIRDVVTVHSELVRHLGIRQLLAVVGGSLGGMQVLEWAILFPDQLKAAVVLASAPNLSAQGIAFNAVGRRAIYADPGFANGDYYDSEGPRYGLALARMVAHITYLSEDSIELKFGRRLQDSDQFAFSMQKETEFQIESYLHYQGKRFVQRFDANSYLYLTRMMDYFDLAEGFASLEAALAQTKARFLVASYDTDWLFPTSQSRELVSALLHVRRHVSFVELRCPFGHDSFLIDIDPLAALVSPFLDRAFDAASV